MKIKIPIKKKTRKYDSKSDIRKLNLFNYAKND